MLRKKVKLIFEIAYLLHFCKLKWSHLQCFEGFRLGNNYNYNLYGDGPRQMR